MLLIKDHPSHGGTVDNFDGSEIMDIGITCSGGFAVVSVKGELDVSSAPWLFECLQGAMDAGILEIVVDIEHLTFMDSAGLTVLVDANRRMQSARGTLMVLSPTPSVKRLFNAAHVVPPLDVRAAA